MPDRCCAARRLPAFSGRADCYGDATTGNRYAGSAGTHIYSTPHGYPVSHSYTNPKADPDGRSYSNPCTSG